MKKVITVILSKNFLLNAERIHQMAKIITKNILPSDFPNIRLMEQSCYDDKDVEVLLALVSEIIQIACPAVHFDDFDSLDGFEDPQDLISVLTEKISAYLTDKETLIIFGKSKKAFAPNQIMVHQTDFVAGQALNFTPLFAA